MAETSSPNGWTLDTLERYLSEKIRAAVEVADEREARNVERNSASKEAVGTAMSAAEKAVARAEAAADKRFDAVNEFRGTLSDLTNTMMPRSEANTLVSALSEKVNDHGARLDKMDGRGTGIKDTISIASALPWVAIAGLILWIFAGHH